MKYITEEMYALFDALSKLNLEMRLCGKKIASNARKYAIFTWMKRIEDGSIKL